MSTNAHHGRSRRTALRLRAIRERITGFRKRARRAATLALATAGLALAPTVVQAQMGQTAMAPAGGLVNRAVAGFEGLNENGPGVLYYGLNAADRGLGYQGSYMTLGGFVPMAEDDLGGFWSADLRSHLSVYGGFFSNVGAVRKQFIGGTLLGVGVYWDYDGDQNQYADTVIPSVGAPVVFAGGQTYNQVGISGEWLTDYGNLRSNGYIPVGTTAGLLGPFAGNSILCVNGVNAALGGADLELGAYIPGLADWAGMVSVGGYAYGNTRYQFPDGQGAVPWFGGVYTRLDMTFVENWDFSLQANNDSYFDWTGFARLTYRMGGSRRRNVSDQVEQPMMRNEHIVRAHQAPLVAINPSTGAPWRVLHVDNTAAGAGGGDGTATDPFTTLGAAAAAATNPFDIVYVHAGAGAATPYITPAGGFTFGAANQYLVGAGSGLAIPTVSCGNRAFFAGNSSDLYPVITNPIGTAIVMDQPNATVSHVQVVGSPVGISDGAGVLPPSVSTISDVIIQGNGGPFQRGIVIANSTGTFNIDNARLSNLTNDGLVVSAAGGVANVTKSSFTSISGNAILASGDGAVVTASATQIAGTVGTAVHASGDAASVSLNAAAISNTGGDAVLASGTGAIVNVATSRITNTTGSALATAVTGTGAAITATATTIDRTGDPAVSIRGAASAVTLDATVITNVTGDGVEVAGAGSRLTMTNASRIGTATGNGISVTGSNAFAAISGRSVIKDIGGDGINSTGGSVHVFDSTIRTVGGDGIDATSVDGNNVVWVQGGTIASAQDNGIRVLNSNLRVEQLNPANPTSAGTRITNTGVYGILATADVYAAATSPYRVLVDSAEISSVINGIGVFANADLANPPGPPILPPPPPVPTIDFTARENQITATGNGISISAVFDGSGGAPGRQLSQVNALIVANQITLSTTGGAAATGTGILLNVAGDPTTFVDTTSGVQFTAPASQLPIAVAAASLNDLENLNNGTTAEITPINSRVNFNTGLIPATPPPPPNQPPP
jgi:hypothetical protein